AAVGQLHDRIDDIFDILWIDEVRHAELARHRFAFRIEIDADDLVRTDHACRLDHVQADAAQAEHDDVGTGFHFRGEQHGTDAGRHAAADVADLVERRVFTDFRQRDFRYDDVVGEGRGAHV